MKPISTFIPRLIAALVMAPIVVSKLTGAPESIHLFEQLGAGDLGRYGTAILELVAIVLLLVPKTRAVGAALTLSILLGAILTHFFKLGVEVTGPDGTGDGGTLFIMAVVGALSSAFVLFRHRDELAPGSK